MKKQTKAELEKLEKRMAKRHFQAQLEEWKRKIIERDNHMCQKCTNYLYDKPKNVHHIISLQQVKRKFPELLTDINNGVLLCSYCHKYAPDSPHQGGFEFTYWLMNYRPDLYIYLREFLSHK